MARLGSSSGAFYGGCANIGRQSHTELRTVGMTPLLSIGIRVQACSVFNSAVHERTAGRSESDVFQTLDEASEADSAANCLYFGDLFPYQRPCPARIRSATPTISGVSVLWWLGTGINGDGGVCSGYSTPCYYAVSQLTSNPNGAPGNPSRTIVQNYNGKISLSCNNCANPVATAQSVSDGCSFDIQVYVSYGGYSSAPFNMSVVAPSYTNLQSGYPQTNPWYQGYLTQYVWGVVDSCGGYIDGGIDANEKIGSVTNVISNNWIGPYPTSVYITTYLIGDEIGHSGGSPAAQPPGNGTTLVRYNYPWALRIGSQTSGSGTPVQADTQAEYLDHGTHQ